MPFFPWVALIFFLWLDLLLNFDYFHSQSCCCRSKQSPGSKLCDMTGITENLRIFAFNNGKFLKSEVLQSPQGIELENDILLIKKVWMFSIFLQKLMISSLYFVIKLSQLVLWYSIIWNEKLTGWIEKQRKNVQILLGDGRNWWQYHR